METNKENMYVVTGNNLHEIVSCIVSCKIMAAVVYEVAI